MRIEPRSGTPDAASDSPYISYECLVWNERFAVVGNGSHTRPIFEKMKAAHFPRDAMMSVLAGLDREFDERDTPRICGLLDLAANSLWLGSITPTAIVVIPIEAAPSQLAYVTTYGFPLPASNQTDQNFTATTATDACNHLMNGSVFAGFVHPVCTAAIIECSGRFDVASSGI